MKRLWKETHLTVVMVTHDLSEAFGLATRVIALERTRNRPEERERYGATVSRDLEIFRAVPQRSGRVYPSSDRDDPVRQGASAGTARRSRLEGAIMILTEQQKAEIAAHTRRYNELKAAGQEHAPRALPSRPRAMPRRSTSGRHSPGDHSVRLVLDDAAELAARHCASSIVGKSTVSLLAWNASDPLERLNHADTIKVQWAARLQKGRVLLSDMGARCSASPRTPAPRMMPWSAARRRRPTVKNTATVISATPATISSCREQARARSPRRPPLRQLLCTGRDRCGRQVCLVRRRRQKGDFVDLRAEMDLLIALSNCPHPLDPAETYPQASVDVVVPPASQRPTICAVPRPRKRFVPSRTTRCISARPSKEPCDDPAHRSRRRSSRLQAVVGDIRKGQTLRISDTHGQQAVDTLFYRADDFPERYSGQDTLRAQGSAYVGLGTRIMSNEGRVMLRVTADSCGLHDTSAGACSCESNTVRFGHQTRYRRACRENFVLEAAKYGMSKRDIVPNLNFFMNVPIDPAGNFTVVDGVSKPGDAIELVAEWTCCA